MRKDKKSKKVASGYKVTPVPLLVQEPSLSYNQPQFWPLAKDFDYKEFKKIADRIPFTQKEWAGLLHISERTLQRYAKDNGVFNFNVADKIFQIDKLIKKGVHVFGSMDKFINWIKDNPYTFEGRLSLNSLASIEGIQLVFTQLGRIEHGILA